MTKKSRRLILKVVNIQTIHTKNLRWIDVVDPHEEEMEWVKSHFKFHLLHFEALAEHQQRPHIDHGTGYEFLVLLFPVYNRESREINPGEVDFFVGDGFLLTAHYGEIQTLKQIFSGVKNDALVRDAFMQKGSGYLLYKILEALFRRSYPILDHMNEDIVNVENRIFHGDGVNLLSRIALMKKNIIEFRKMMKTHRYVLEHLPRSKSSYLTFSQSKTYYKDLLEYSQNIWDILEALKETADTLADTNQALAAQKLNQITKLISVTSAIVLPATLIAFIFGMTSEFVPFRHHPNGFWIVITIMALVSLIMLWIFKRKKWF